MDYITLRVRKDTHYQLKVVASLSGESMLDTLARLVREEYDRLLQQKGGKAHAAQQKDQAPRE